MTPATIDWQAAEEVAAMLGVHTRYLVAGRKPAPEGMGAGGLVYSRFNHPNTEIVEDRLSISDGAEGSVSVAR